MTAYAYYELQDQARSKWMRAQELIDRIEYLYAHCRIDDDEKYRLFVQVQQLQDQAMELEKKATDAQVEVWKHQYAEEIMREKEYQEQMHDERP